MSNHRFPVLPSNKEISKQLCFSKKEIKLIRENKGKHVQLVPKHTIKVEKVDGKDVKRSYTEHVPMFVLKFVNGKYKEAPSGVPLVRKGE